MIPFLRDKIGDLFRFITRIPDDTWIYVIVAVIIIGVICLRGYGSRSNY